VLQQFWIFFKNLLHGDFGSTLLTGRPVMEDLARLLPATAELATVMIILGAGIGIPLGVYAAVNRGRASPVMRCVSSHCLALNTYLLDRHGRADAV
jgi:ABC-type dipeptide/oligopeptide/nickel transport system permease component